MSYSNIFLMNFRPVYMEILSAKGILPEKAELIVIDEEDGEGIFETSDARDVLEQIAEDLNFLTIYTDRPAYFEGFAETMYEENGLVVMIFSKQELRWKWTKMTGGKLILDFEWNGNCYDWLIRPGKYYIPIHKKPWETGENLDIIVPIGYNTVIVKRPQNIKKKPLRDRFEEAFYSS